MTLTTEQREAIHAAAKPLIDHLDKNFHPHVKVIVDSDTVEVVEGLCITHRLGYRAKKKKGSK